MTTLIVSCPYCVGDAWLPLQEVQALAAVGAHPNIVQYYSAWAEPDMQGDQLYIQMELCGDSLAAITRLRDKQPWREPELIGLLKQVCSFVPRTPSTTGLVACRRSIKRQRHTYIIDVARAPMFQNLQKSTPSLCNAMPLHHSHVARTFVAVSSSLEPQ